MADLEVILASGDISDIKQNNNQVVDTDNIAAALAVEYMDGLNIPEVLTANSDLGTIFWDSGVGRLRYKSPGGIVLEFTMTLV